MPENEHDILRKNGQTSSRTANQSINQSNSQSINQSANQPINRSIEASLQNSRSRAPLRFLEFSIIHFRQKRPTLCIKTKARSKTLLTSSKTGLGGAIFLALASSESADSYTRVYNYNKMKFPVINRISIRRWTPGTRESSLLPSRQLLESSFVEHSHQAEISRFSLVLNEPAAMPGDRRGSAGIPPRMGDPVFPGRKRKTELNTDLKKT